MNPVQYALNRIGKKAQELFQPVQQHFSAPRQVTGQGYQGLTQQFRPQIQQATNFIGRQPIMPLQLQPVRALMGKNPNPTIKQFIQEVPQTIGKGTGITPMLQAQKQYGSFSPQAIEASTNVALNTLGGTQNVGKKLSPLLSPSNIKSGGGVVKQGLQKLQSKLKPKPQVGGLAKGEKYPDILGFTEGAKETAIPIRSNGKIVGGIEAAKDRFYPQRLNLVNIRITPEQQGKGLGTDAVNQLFKDNPDINEIVGHSTAEGKSFYQKLGAKFSGQDDNVFTITRQSPLSQEVGKGLKDYKIKNDNLKIEGGTTHDYGEDLGAYIDRIDVKKQGQGTGTKAVQDFEGWAKKQGAKNLYVESEAGALDFWAKQGFEPISHNPDSPLTTMRKSLTQSKGVKGEAQLSMKMPEVLEPKINVTKGGKVKVRMKPVEAPQMKPIEDDFLKSLETPSPNASAQVANPRVPLSPKEALPPQKTPTQEQGLFGKDFERNETLKKSIAGANMEVNKKVNLLDYLRTPEHVLNKLGLQNEGKLLRRASEGYNRDLRNEIGKVTEWQKQAPSPESSYKIFQHLDGDKNVVLAPNEQKVATQIKSYLEQWADKLDLPKDRRIADYITHVFDFDVVKKEFDPDIAKIIQDKVPGSVYNPFLEQRLGKLGYKQDVWSALDAYVKRATRKVNMDPALHVLSSTADNFEPTTFKYIKRYADNINMRPTEVESLMDNLIKQSPIGYKLGQRPTINVTSKQRQMVFRGALGLNLSSALRNLTQGVNTYSKLGNRGTIAGYAQVIKRMATGNLDELVEQGVLSDNIVQDRNLSVTKQALQKLDSGLFKFFDIAEKINRGSAYFGAKSVGLRKGLSEEKAIEFAKKIVRETQFQYGPIDNPVALNSTLTKTATQFMSYPIKQTEFLVNMAKNKEFGGLARYILGTFVAVNTIGKLFGMRPQEFIPFFDNLTGEQKFQTPIMQIAGTAKGMVSTNPDEREQANRDLLKTGALLFPAGVQIKKTIEGLQATDRGYGQSPSGRVRYQLPQDTGARIRGGLFGQYAFDEAREYFDKQGKGEANPLGEKQSAAFKQLAGDARGAFIKTVEQKRNLEREGKAIKDGQIEGASVDAVAQAYGYGKYLKPAPSQGLEKYDWDDKKLTEAVRLYNDKEIPQQQKGQLLQKYGYNQQDLQYEAGTRLNNKVTTGYLADTLRNKPYEQVLEQLRQGRRESLSGNQLVTSGVIDSLVDLGIITEADGKALKKLKYDNKGSLQIKSGGAKKPKKLSLKKISIKKGKAPKSAKIKMKKLPKLKFAKAKKTKILKVKSDVVDKFDKWSKAKFKYA